MLAVQEYLCIAINSAETQEDLILFGTLRRHESPAVPPLIAFVRSQEIHIAACFRILDKAGRQQIKFDISWHLSIYGLKFNAPHIFRRQDWITFLFPVIQNPSAIK